MLTLTATAHVVDRVEVDGVFLARTHCLPKDAVCSVCGLPASVGWCTLDALAAAAWADDQSSLITFGIDPRCGSHYDPEQPEPIVVEDAAPSKPRAKRAAKKAPAKRAPVKKAAAKKRAPAKR